jgi:hypothetical protein
MILQSPLDCKFTSSAADDGRLTSIVQTARLRAPAGVLQSFLHFTHDNLASPAFSRQLQSFLSTPTSAPPLKPVALLANKVAVGLALFNDLFGDLFLEGLRCRETVARFMLVSSFRVFRYHGGF